MEEKASRAFCIPTARIVEFFLLKLFCMTFVVVIVYVDHQSTLSDHFHRKHEIAGAFRGGKFLDLVLCAYDLG